MAFTHAEFEQWIGKTFVASNQYPTSGEVDYMCASAKATLEAEVGTVDDADDTTFVILCLLTLEIFKQRNKFETGMATTDSHDHGSRSYDSVEMFTPQIRRMVYKKFSVVMHDAMTQYLIDKWS